MKGRVLIVDDDIALSEMLGIALRGEGFETTSVADGDRALAAFRDFKPDLVLLDLMLPGRDGIDVCRQIRGESGVPIIMLTAKSDTVDVVVGLESGADDYVIKPFKVKELVARVRARLRRADEPKPETLTIGDLSIDVAGHSVKRDGRQIPLTPLEFDLLVALARKPWQVFTREVLLEQVWGYRHAADTRLVNVHVQRLRAKVERDPEKPDASTATWQSVTKDAIKADFRAGEIRILLCTDAASEGLNLQSAALLFNYDMPWNPMRVEQRIGRIDRIGQPNDTVEIVNYYYEGTVEADIYRALRQRINIFEVVVGRLQPILAAIGGRVESGLLENIPMETIAESIGAEIDRAEREGIDIEAYAASGVTHRITKHPLPVTPADIDQALCRAVCLYEAGYIFTSDEHRPGVYVLNGPDCPAQAVTFLPEVYDQYPETVRYLTYTDELFGHLLTTVPPINVMPGVERVERGNDVAYVSSMGNVGTINALEEAMESGDVVPASVIAFALERLAVRERAEKTTIDGIDRRRVSAHRAMARDLLSAYLSLVAQDAQVPPGLAVDSRYLLSKARPQDQATLVTLFEVAGRPDAVEIAYDNTRQINGANMASALANQRQQAQRFLGTIVA